MNSSKRGGLNITLLVQDECWNKLGTFKWNSSDKNKQKNIIRGLEDAFGLNFKQKSDLDWMK